MKHKNQKKKYFSMATAGRKADIYIFGDITSWEYLESDVSSYTLARAVQDLDVDEIAVHINSYGGETAEGLAIYNSLKNHPARIRTICDGFACSAASVVFMAGDDRVMNDTSLLMVHNAWTSVSGNAKELRKEANDLELISNTAARAYQTRVSISEEQLSELLENETWITPANALAWGFATEILEQEAAEAVSQSARAAVFQTLTGGPTRLGIDAGIIQAGTIKTSEPVSPPKPEEKSLSTFLSALSKGQEGAAV